MVASHALLVACNGGRGGVITEYLWIVTSMREGETQTPEVSQQLHLLIIVCLCMGAKCTVIALCASSHNARIKERAHVCHAHCYWNVEARCP